MVEVPGGPTASNALARLSEFVRSEPLLVAGAVVAVVLLGVAAWYLRRRSPAERLHRVLADSEQVTVLMHTNPDPDAMASAMAVAAIADATLSGDDEAMKTDGSGGADESAVPTDVADEDDEDGPSKATLAYPGEIRHQENRAFRNALDMDAERVSSTAELDGDVVLVDQNEARGLSGGDVDPVAVVDHHSGDGTVVHGRPPRLRGVRHAVRGVLRRPRRRRRRRRDRRRPRPDRGPRDGADVRHPHGHGPVDAGVL